MVTPRYLPETLYFLKTFSSLIHVLLLDSWFRKVNTHFDLGAIFGEIWEQSTDTLSQTDLIIVECPTLTVSDDVDLIEF